MVTACCSLTVPRFRGDRFGALPITVGDSFASAGDLDFVVVFAFAADTFALVTAPTNQLPFGFALALLSIGLTNQLPFALAFPTRALPVLVTLRGDPFGLGLGEGLFHFHSARAFHSAF